jgi:hypothetical protein
MKNKEVVRYLAGLTSEQEGQKALNPSCALPHYRVEALNSAVEACNNYEKLQQINRELIGEFDYIALQHDGDLEKLGYTTSYIDMVKDLINRAKELTYK